MTTEDIQSYNHFMPQSIIKNGWGYKFGKNKSVNVLDYSRLKKFISSNENFNKKDLLDALKNNFGETEDKNTNLIIRRNPDSIMGNKLVFNLTEKKLGELQWHVEKDIESIIYDSLKNNLIEKNNIIKLYNWFALQKSRSMAELMSSYFCFLKKNNIPKINNQQEYLNFKKFYNKSVHNYFNEYTQKYINERYICLIPQFNLNNKKEIFLFLGELNTLYGRNFINVIIENNQHLNRYGCNLQPIHYCLLCYLDISIISKDSMLVLHHPRILKEELILLSEAISTCWNAYQVAQETKNLIVTEKCNQEIELIADIIMYQKNNGTLKQNINFQNDYLELVKLSENMEKT